jgi:hypothetical protein
MEKSMKLTRLFLICILACSVTFTACNRKKTTDTVEPDPDLSTERDFSNADNDNNSLLRDIDKALDNSSASLREEAVANYFTLSEKDSTGTIAGFAFTRYSKLVYLGSGEDGQSRTGSATIFSIGKRVNGDFEAYVLFEGTKIGGRTITGNKKITQQSSGDTNKWQFFITASGTVTTIEGKTITYISNRTRVRTGISSLLDISDDSFTITGSWTGTNGNGESVIANITSPLQLSYNCSRFREITSGTIVFVNNSKGVSRSIDYGSGTCDGKGTFINAKGRTFTFYFKR